MRLGQLTLRLHSQRTLLVQLRLERVQVTGQVPHLLHHRGAGARLVLGKASGLLQLRVELLLGLGKAARLRFRVLELREQIGVLGLQTRLVRLNVTDLALRVLSLIK